MKKFLSILLLIFPSTIFGLLSDSNIDFSDAIDDINVCTIKVKVIKEGNATIFEQNFTR